MKTRGLLASGQMLLLFPAVWITGNAILSTAVSGAAWSLWVMVVAVGLSTLQVVVFLAARDSTWPLSAVAAACWLIASPGMANAPLLAVAAVGVGLAQAGLTFAAWSLLPPRQA